MTTGFSQVAALEEDGVKLPFLVRPTDLEPQARFVPCPQSIIPNGGGMAQFKGSPEPLNEGCVRISEGLSLCLPD